MDLVVSSTLALDATHDVECYAAASGRAQFCTSLLWSRKKAEAARVRSPSDLQSRRSKTGERVAFLDAPQGTNIEWKKRRDGGYHRSIDPLEEGAVQNVLPLVGLQETKA